MNFTGKTLLSVAVVLANLASGLAIDDKLNVAQAGDIATDISKRDLDADFCKGIHYAVPSQHGYDSIPNKYAENWFPVKVHLPDRLPEHTIWPPVLNWQASHTSEFNFKVKFNYKSHNKPVLNYRVIVEATETTQGQKPMLPVDFQFYLEDCPKNVRNTINMYPATPKID